MSRSGNFYFSSRHFPRVEIRLNPFKLVPLNKLVPLTCLTFSCYIFLGVLGFSGLYQILSLYKIDQAYIPNASCLSLAWTSSLLNNLLAAYCILRRIYKRSSSVTFTAWILGRIIIIKEIILDYSGDKFR